MILNLTYVKRTPKTAASGKPYISLSIKAREYGEKYLGGFGNQSNESWKVGDAIEVEAVTEKVVGGKNYLNFEMLKVHKANANIETMALSHKLDQVIQQNRSIIDHLSGKQLLNMTSAGTKVPDFSEVDSIRYPEGEINPDDVPF